VRRAGVPGQQNVVPAFFVEEGLGVEEEVAQTAYAAGLASEEKRFCTMHLCMHPMPSSKRQQPSPALIFRGQGHTATMIAERGSYHPNVKVFLAGKTHG
jgi:hypothetical protein